MKKVMNRVENSIEITAHTLKEEIELNRAVDSGILEKKCFGTWHIKADGVV